MPLDLSQHELYIKPVKGSEGYIGQCYACHGVQSSSPYYKEAWALFQSKSEVIEINSHRLWVCHDCKREFDKGTLLSTSLNKFNRHARPPETRR